MDEEMKKMEEKKTEVIYGEEEEEMKHPKIKVTKEGYDGQDFGPMYDWMIRTGGVRVTGNKNR